METRDSSLFSLTSILLPLLVEIRRLLFSKKSFSDNICSVSSLMWKNWDFVLFLESWNEISGQNLWPYLHCDLSRASIRPSEAKAPEPYDKTEFRTEFSGSWNSEAMEFFGMNQIWRLDIEKRESVSLYLPARWESVERFLICFGLF